MKKETYITDIIYKTDAVRLELEKYRSALCNAFIYLSDEQKDKILQRYNVSLIPELPIEVFQEEED